MDELKREDAMQGRGKAGEPWMDLIVLPVSLLASNVFGLD